MTLLEKIAKITKLEEEAVSYTAVNCSSIMNALLYKVKRDDEVAATLMNVYLECSDKESVNKVFSAIIGMTFDEFLTLCIDGLEMEICTDGKEDILNNWVEITG